MDIKRVLKNLDIGVSRLAKDLNISRPTLDTYIECFDNSQPIPNTTYQTIFDYLFDDENQSTIEFAKKFDYVKREILKDNNSNKNIDHETIQNLNKYILDDKSDELLIKFINLFIKNDKNELVKYIYSYFNYVNGLIEYDENNIADKEKAVYSKLYELFSNFKDSNFDINQEAYSKFKDKCKNKYKMKNMSQDDLILDYVKNRVENDLEIDNSFIKAILNYKEKDNGFN